MKVGIIGIGVVGNAMYRSLLEKSNNNSAGGDVIVAYDKFKNIGSFDDMLDTDMVFLCLPTLYSYNTSSYDKTALHEICGKLAENNYQGLVVIKSTVEPTTTQSFANKYKLSMFHNPEFLSARTAFEDFRDQSHIIIGQSSNSTSDQLDKLVGFYQKYFPGAQISTCVSTESECVKIFCNCFYAVKVQFFNELYLMCNKLNIDYSTVKNTMLKNNWINPMHTDVPGPNGQLSYGGMCFPKDTNALLSFMKELNTPHAVLEGTVVEHDSMKDGTDLLLKNLIFYP